MPVVEDFELVWREGAIIGHGILGCQTRLSETPGTIFACEYIVRAASAIHVAFSGDVKYIPCEVSRGHVEEYV